MDGLENIVPIRNLVEIYKDNNRSYKNNDFNHFSFFLANGKIII